MQHNRKCLLRMHHDMCLATRRAYASAPRSFLHLYIRSTDLAQCQIGASEDGHRAPAARAMQRNANWFRPQSYLLFLCHGNHSGARFQPDDNVFRLFFQLVEKIHMIRAWTRVQKDIITYLLNSSF